MKFRHGPSIDYNELQELRKGMELQFRFKFYKDPKFPFLQSIGIKHIIQGFDAGDNIGFIGMLHLWWVSDPTGTVTGIWESEWIDTPHEGIALSQALTQNKLYDEQKLVHAHMKEIAKMAEEEGMKQLRERSREQAEEESKTVLWN
tara:strand:+ start:160 stop:597 length:438 start_codon:yes stop_codon:yes gene_type:complete